MVVPRVVQAQETAVRKEKRKYDGAKRNETETGGALPFLARSRVKLHPSVMVR